MFTPALSQLLGIEVIRRYDDFVAARVAELQPSAEVLARRITRDFDGWTFNPPRGGLSLWATLPNDISADAFVQAAGHRGVLVASGREFCPNDADCSSIRLPFTAPVDVLETAMDRLAETWASVYEPLARTGG